MLVESCMVYTISEMTNRCVVDRIGFQERMIPMGVRYPARGMHGTDLDDRPHDLLQHFPAR